MGKNLDIMKAFDMKNIPDLDICVLGALELFMETKIPKIKLKEYNRVLVVGSGNALATGKIIFNDKDAVFASEGTYKNPMEKIEFDLVVIISASGEKHAPIIAKNVESNGIRSVLFTTNENTSARKIVDEIFIFPKQREPYTYNTSTYLSMILGKTMENPKKIYDYIKKIDGLVKKDFSNYDSFFLILPSEFELVREMFLTKFDELFGPIISGRAYTIETAKHAKTVVNSTKELFISFGWENNLFGFENSRLNIPLPRNADFATIIAIGYYIIGKIQKAHPPYFKGNINAYAKKASDIFKQEIEPIVE